MKSNKLPHKDIPSNDKIIKRLDIPIVKDFMQKKIIDEDKETI